MSAHSLFDDPEDDHDLDDDRDVDSDGRDDVVSYEDDEIEHDAADDDNEIPDDPDDADAGHVEPASDAGTTDADDVADAAEPGEEVDDVTAVVPHGTTATPRLARFGDLVLEYKWWTNPRRSTGLSDPEIRALADSICAGTAYTDNGAIAGVTQPLEVVQIAVNGGVVTLVIDGQRRHMAITLADLGDDVLVPVRDLEPEPIEWTPLRSAQFLFRALETVGQRAGLSSAEIAASAERLRASTDPETGKEYTLAKIALGIGRSESWVSKILAALKRATPKIRLDWETGKITDEQFKDLAASPAAEQKEAAKRVVEAREAGDVREARTIAKEQGALARASKKDDDKKKPTKKDKVSAKKKEESHSAPDAVPAPAPKKSKPLPMAVMDDLLFTAKKHPPTHDYVRGLLDGMQYAAGMIDAAGLAKPFQSYLLYVQNAQMTDRAANAPAKSTGGSKRKTTKKKEKKSR